MKTLLTTGLLVAGILAAGATPASAAEGVDLGITIKGTTISWSDASKPATVSVTNHGTTAPAAASIRFDPTGLTGPAGLLFSFGAPSGSGCDFSTTVKVCELAPEQIPAPGKTIDLDLWIYNNNMEPGVQGTLVARVTAEGDTGPANDETRVDVAMSGARGPDLRALAEDVTSLNTGGEPSADGLQPGENSALFATVVNHGAEAAKDIVLRFTLPEHVTFTTRFDECTYDTGLTEATCRLGAGVILTGDDPRGLQFRLPVKLATDATGPARLTGGVFTVSGKYVDLSAVARTTTTLPEFATEVDPSQITDEVDESDNSDTFVALVGAPESDGGTGGGTDEPTLPITGPVAASAATGGAVLLVAGVLLLMAARRRRVVLVNPDGSSTSDVTGGGRA